MRKDYNHFVITDSSGRMIAVCNDEETANKICDLELEQFQAWNAYQSSRKRENDKLEIIKSLKADLAQIT